MKPVTIWIVLALAVCCGVGWGCGAETGRALADPGDRPAVVADRFYPGDATKLEQAIRAYLAAATVPCDGATAAEPPLALVAPHAGYLFSGQICADAYRQALGHEYELVVILGTNHTSGSFDKVSLYPGSGYQTPLGLCEIDQDVTAALLAADPRFVFEPALHESEHSVEVQVPFIQVAFPEAKIVAAVVGRPDLDLCRRFGQALANTLAGRRVLVVASSDLSHYPSYADGVASDGATLAAIASFETENVIDTIGQQLRRGRHELRTCACGEAPILTAMFAAEALGATHGDVVSYANSGDCAVGDLARVVGYGAVVFRAGPESGGNDGLIRPEVAPASASLQSTDRQALLQFARHTIQQFLETETLPLARDFSPVLNRKQGAFVTLKRHGQLRGCIGHMAEDLPLCQVVGAMAYQAAFNDRRFRPLRSDELADVEIEISVLTPFTRVTGPEAIVVGRDGVVLRKSDRSAVYLPQVATEQGWTREEMLDNLCRKAGLSAGEWRRGAELHTFQAIVFHE
ncbi:MAG: AmmeMemoRadiSam system protein B [bacterium]